MSLIRHYLAGSIVPPTPAEKATIRLNYSPNPKTNIKENIYAGRIGLFIPRLSGVGQN
jgi:hypothetical protein